MLPNWLLGKSKSKLQEILGGGGGGATYTAGDGIDISDSVISFDPATAPVIDSSKVDGLDDDLATLAPKAALCNPNILHNPWFSVNQRGFTTNTGSAQMWPADRWYIIGDNKTVTRASDGMLTIKNEANTNVYLTQKGATNKMASLIGKKVTASIMMGDGTIKSGTITFNANERQSYISESNFELYKNNSSGNNILLAFTMPAGELTIKALKLELGEVSTLAMEPRPDMATELAKCQRYFIRLKNDSANTNMPLAPGIGSSSTAIIFILGLPSQMITTPSISTPSSSAIIIERLGATNPTGTPTLTMKNSTANILRIDVTGVGATANAVYYLTIATSQYIDFDAEL